jgi:hypothetical protein
MATTTNFGWDTPDDTDLVKDGAAAIRTLGSSIDTSFVDLKGGSTNEVLAKNSGTDLDFKWVADATGIPATIFDAKGDIIAATAADTADRLAVGANDTVLTADSTAATGLKWASAPAPSYTYSSYTPAFTQSGSLTLSSSTAAYVVIGDFVHVQLKAAFSSAGTSNNVITMTLPVNASTTTVDGSTAMGVGSVVIYDTSAISVYWGFATIKSANQVLFKSGFNKSVATDAEVWGKTGSDFAIAIASGDTVNVSLCYRKA